MTTNVTLDDILKAPINQILGAAAIDLGVRLAILTSAMTLHPKLFDQTWEQVVSETLKNISDHAPELEDQVKNMLDGLAENTLKLNRKIFSE